MKLGRAVWFCMLLVSVAGLVHAQSARKTAEAGMLVTGTVEVNPDGSLHGYTIDQQDKLPPVVVDVVGKNLPLWAFKLSSPASDVIKSKMSLRILAKPAGDGKYKVSIAGASFGEDHSQTGETVSYKSHTPAPSYPAMAVNARVSGTVYLLLRIGRDGAVQEAFAEQVNLEQYGTNSEMNSYRKALSDASIKAAKEWTYNLPTHGKSVDDPFWVVRVPVNFSLFKDGRPLKEHPYGSWNGYIPGPRQSPPWASPVLLSEAPDAVSDGALHSGNSGLQLATPLSGS